MNHVAPLPYPFVCACPHIAHRFLVLVPYFWQNSWNLSRSPYFTWRANRTFGEAIFLIFCAISELSSKAVTVYNTLFEAFENFNGNRATNYLQPTGSSPAGQWGYINLLLWPFDFHLHHTNRKIRAGEPWLTKLSLKMQLQSKARRTRCGAESHQHTLLNYKWNSGSPRKYSSCLVWLRRKGC